MNDMQSFFHDTGNGFIFCTLIGNSSKSNKCSIVFSPLFEERMWSQRVILNYSNKLWENGISVLLFDYYGYGESDGDTEDFTLMRCRKDVCSLLLMLENRFDYKKFSFLGIRTGCIVQLSCFSDVQKKISSMLFWAPVLDASDYIYQALRSTITTQSWVFKKIVANRNQIIAELIDSGKCVRGNYLLNHIDGYRVGKNFYLEIQNVNFQEVLLNLNCRSYVLEVLAEKKKESLTERKEILKKKYGESINISYEIIATREFWINNLSYSQQADDIYQLTLNWFRING